MEEIKIKWKHIIIISWSYFWRFLCISFGFSLVITILALIKFNGWKNIDMDILYLVLWTMQPTMMIPFLSVFVFKMILGKKYGKFALKLVSDKN